MAQAYSPKIITDDLLVCLDFANPKCTTGDTITDLANSDTVITKYGSPTLTNGVMVFDGISDYLTLQRSDINSGAWAYDYVTAQMWLKMPSAPSAYMFVCESAWETRAVETDFQSASTPWAWKHVGGTGELIPNEWMFVTFVHGADGFVRFYVGDQELSGAVNHAGPLQVGNAITGALMYIAGRPVYGSPTDMEIGAAYIYGTTFFEEEIAQNYRAMKGRYE